MNPVLFLAWVFAFAAAAADFKAGLARTNITPALPFWLSGYAARTNPATRVRSPLWAKALALEDAGGRRAVIVTTDLIGLPREITEAAADAGGSLGLYYHKPYTGVSSRLGLAIIQAAARHRRFIGLLEQHTNAGSVGYL